MSAKIYENLQPLFFFQFGNYRWPGVLRHFEFHCVLSGFKFSFQSVPVNSLLISENCEKVRQESFSWCFKGLLHCFSACIEITGNNCYWFDLKNVENCKEKFQGLKSYKEFKLAKKYAKTHMTSFELFRLIKLKKKISPILYILYFFLLK